MLFLVQTQRPSIETADIKETPFSRVGVGLENELIKPIHLLLFNSLAIACKYVIYSLIYSLQYVEYEIT